LNQCNDAGLNALEIDCKRICIHDIHGYTARVKELNKCNDVGLNALEIGCKQEIQTELENPCSERMKMNYSALQLKK
jgi:hypothetical protein